MALAAEPAAVAPPPPPAPTPGSDDWLESPQNAIVAPGPEATAAGMNLASFETGNIAVNLGAYLGAKAVREEADGKMDKILLADLERAQPCVIEIGADGQAKCKVGTGVGGGSWLPDEILGIHMPWASSTEEGGKDAELSSGQVFLLLFMCQFVNFPVAHDSAFVFYEFDIYT